MKEAIKIETTNENKKECRKEEEGIMKATA
jgi:hypothetical protein